MSLLCSNLNIFIQNKSQSSYDGLATRPLRTSRYIIYHSPLFSLSSSPMAASLTSEHTEDNPASETLYCIFT